MTLLIELRPARRPTQTTPASAFGHGTTNAFDEAAWLVLWRWACRWTQLGRSRRDGACRRGECDDACGARSTSASQSRKPAAYLTREAWLQGVPFYVDERSIVPRSFIAELIADGDASMPG